MEKKNQCFNSRHTFIHIRLVIYKSTLSVNNMILSLIFDLTNKTQRISFIIRFLYKTQSTSITVIFQQKSNTENKF